MLHKFKMTHKSTAFQWKSIRKSYKSVLKSYKSTIFVDFVDDTGEE